MTVILVIAAIGVLAAMAFIGSRRFKPASTCDEHKTPAQSNPAQPATYFERYVPRRTSGHGEAL